MKNMQINEIFYSLQGEGHWTGTASIFIRFAGCNLKCKFCDTLHETPVKTYSINQLLEEIEQYPSKRIILTGGEPGLQVNEELIDSFHKKGYMVHIETNGTVNLPKNIDWVTCSPKTKILTVKKIDELKIVVGDSATKFEDINDYLAIDATEYYLQPCDTGSEEKNRETTAKIIEYILNHPKFKLSLQTHKMLAIR